MYEHVNKHGAIGHRVTVLGLLAENIVDPSAEPKVEFVRPRRDPGVAKNQQQSKKRWADKREQAVMRRDQAFQLLATACRWHAKSIHGAKVLRRHAQLNRKCCATRRSESQR